MATMEGRRVPKATFKVLINGTIENYDSEDIFNKNVVAFSLPGAFTPTCSGRHVPRFHELADSFANIGITRIVCISVNDAYVMKAWADKLAIDQLKVLFLADGNAEFTRAMGMLMDKSSLGFGQRSRRYAMVVRSNVIEKMFCEPEDVSGDPYEVSSADSVLNYLGGNVKLPPEITVFTRQNCPYCYKAKRFLHDHKLPFYEIPVDAMPSSALRGIAASEKVPQIFINGQHIGGFDQLVGHSALLPLDA